MCAVTTYRDQIFWFVFAERRGCDNATEISGPLFRGGKGGGVEVAQARSECETAPPIICFVFFMNSLRFTISSFHELTIWGEGAKINPGGPATYAPHPRVAVGGAGPRAR